MATTDLTYPCLVGNNIVELTAAQRDELVRRQMPRATLTDEDIATLRHARTFLISREKMHPEGVAQWDAMLKRLGA